MNRLFLKLSNSTKSIIFALLVLFFVILVVNCENSEGKTITVDYNGEGEYETIQEAVDNSTEGDIIKVWRGVYKENVIINKTLSLIGNGSDVTTIDGGSEGDVVTITKTNWCNVSGFNIINGGNDGIYLDVSDSNTISNNTIQNNSYGIEIWSSESNTISRNIMIKNGIFLHGNSLKYWNTHNITTDNYVNGRTVCYYKNETSITVPSGVGQIIFTNCTDMIVENQNLSNCSVSVLNGYSSNLTISNNTFQNNSYGIYFFYSNLNTIYNNTIQNNDNGIYLHYLNSNTISNNTIHNNIVGIYLYRSNSNPISNNTIQNNDDGIYFHY